MCNILPDICKKRQNFRKNDKIKSSGGQAIFSGDGNDIITGLKGSIIDGFTTATFMAGGSGSDKYIVKKGSSSIIFEQSNQGNDFVDLNAIKTSNDAFFISLDEVDGAGQFWALGDNNTAAIVSGNIEKFKFAGKTLSAEALQDKLGSSGAVTSSASSFLDMQNSGIIDMSIFGMSADANSIQDFVDSAIYNSNLV